MISSRFGHVVIYSFLLLLVAACEQEQNREQQTSTTTQSTSSAATTRSCILMVGWDEREPFHYRAPDGSAFGIDIDIVNHVAKEAGCAMRYRQIPQEQQRERLEAGDVDLVLGSYRGLDVPPGLVYSEPYRSETYDLHVISGSPVHRDDLEMLIKLDFDLGLTSGYSYQEPVVTLRNDLIHKKQFVTAPSSVENIDNLLNGEVDGILEDPLVVRAIADRELLEGRVEHLSIQGGVQEVYLLFNEKEVPADVLSRLNQAITHMKRDGTYQEIVGRHSR